MNNKCIYLKQKFDRTIICKRTNKTINLKDCSNCKYKKYKNTTYTLKKTTKCHAKKEKERFSIIYTDKTKCCYCGTKIGHIDTNEVFSGAYRILSIKFGACNYYCRACHNRYDVDRLFNLKEKVKFQKELVKIYGYDWFISTFKKDYEYELEKYLKTSSKAGNR